jgi:hypothetical protein
MTNLLIRSGRANMTDDLNHRAMLALVALAKACHPGKLAMVGAPPVWNAAAREAQIVVDEYLAGEAEKAADAVEEAAEPNRAEENGGVK